MLGVYFAVSKNFFKFFTFLAWNIFRYYNELRLLQEWRDMKIDLHLEFVDFSSAGHDSTPSWLESTL